jgi:large subunit ribosomal protein L17
MFRNMLVSLLQHERIRTTLAKAKELRGWVDRVISWGKRNDLHSRRLAFALLRDEGTVKKLFDVIAPKLKGREGGYTRIYKMGWRPGDNAPLSLIELVTYAPVEEKKKSPMTKAKAVLEKVTPKKKGREEKEEEGKKEKKGEKTKKEKKEKVEKKEKGEKKEKKEKKEKAPPKEKKKPLKKKSK